MPTTRLLLVLGLLAGAAAAQEKPPGPDPEAARAASAQIREELETVAQSRKTMDEREERARGRLEQARASLAELERAYADGGEGLPREEVLRLMDLLRERTGGEALQTELEPIERAENRARERATRAGDRLVGLEEQFTKWRKADPERADLWREIERERAELLRELRSRATAVARQAAEIQLQVARLHETWRKTLFLLVRENLFIRGEPRLTREALAGGLDDVKRLPAWLGRTATDVSSYVTRHGAGLIGYLAAVATLFLVLFFGRRMLRGRPGLVSRLVRALGTATFVFLVFFLAAAMLPELRPGVRALLRSLAFIAGPFWILRAINRQLVRPGILRADERGVAMLRLGLALLLWLSVLFLPLAAALAHLGYENDGMREFLWLVYEALVGGVVVATLLRKPVLAAITGRDRTPPRAVRYLRPIAILVVPALIAFDALEYDVLAELVLSIAIALVTAMLIGTLLHRAGRYALEHAMRERPPAARDGLSFLYSLFIFFAAVYAFLVLSGSSLGELRAFLDAPLPLLDPAGEHVVTWWNVVLAAFLLFLFLAAAKHVKRALQDLVLAGTNLDKGVQYTITTLSGYVIIALGLYLGLSQLFDFSALGYVLAALSVGIGFGLQEIVSNFISGLILLFERPLKVGDLVQVGDTEGVVRHISIRATTVQTPDNVYLMVPNRVFITEPVTNFAHRDPKIRLRVPLGVSYGSDTALVRKVLMDVAAGHDRVLETPAPEVWFRAFGDSSIDFELLAWIARPHGRWRISSELYFAIFDAFREHKIEIPFPQRDLHLRSAVPLETNRRDAETQS